MISYTLNSPHYDYQGGGISPTSYQTVTTTEDKFYQTLDNTVNMINPSGLVSGAMDLLGIGPEDWASVEQRFRGYFDLLKQEVDRRLKLVKSLNDLNEVDKYISMAATAYADTSWLSSSNSINGHALVGRLLFELRDAIRAELSKKYKLTAKSGVLYGEQYRDPRGFVFGYKGVVNYMVYTDKPVVKEPVQTVDVTGKPVTDVGTGVPTTDVNIPTDSPYFEDKPKENEGSFNWLYVIIPVAVVGLWKLGEYLFKNIKKKK
ncbi:hypothetical protein [Tenacibaculum ascidiaceicola]|uniref:hypothetical protein n=1 Tax=Tenacibaculum ascidiaceicola TaxID=1699411 RepID=UPI0038958351